MSALPNGKHTPADATTASITLTLPTSPAAGGMVSVEKIDSSTHTVTITGNMRGASGQTIVMSLYRESIGFLADGDGSWWPIWGHKTLSSLTGIFLTGRYVDNGTVSPNITLGDPTAAAAAIASDVTGGVLLNPGGQGYNNVIGGDGSATVGTTTPNVAATGTNANQSLIGGYDNVAGALSSKIISDHSYVGTDATGGHNAIYGGSNNKIHGAGTSRAGIFAGYQCDVSASYSVAMGFSHTVSGGSALASGDHHTVSGTGGVATGTTNVVSGNYARAHGSTCTASGSFSSAEGFHAVARRFGQHAYASGRVAVDGDVQASFYTLFGTTTDATPTNLGVDGGNTYNSSHWMLRGQTVMVQAIVTGRSSGGGTNVGFVVRALVHYEATGNAAVIGVPSVEAFNAPAGCSATFVVSSGSTGSVTVQVTGVAATTIQWSAKADLVESLLA